VGVGTVWPALLWVQTLVLDPKCRTSPRVSPAVPTHLGALLSPLCARRRPAPLLPPPLCAHLTERGYEITLMTKGGEGTEAVSILELPPAALDSVRARLSELRDGEDEEKERAAGERHYGRHREGRPARRLAEEG